MRLLLYLLFAVLIVTPFSQVYADNNVSSVVYIGNLITVTFTYPDIINTPPTKFISISISITIEASKKTYIKYLLIIFYYSASYGSVHEAYKYLLIKDTYMSSDHPIQVQYNINIYDGEGQLIAKILFTGGRGGLWYPEEGEPVYRYEYQDYNLYVSLSHIHSYKYTSYDTLLLEYNNLLDNYNEIQKRFTALNAELTKLGGRYNTLFKSYIELYDRYRRDILILSMSTVLLFTVILAISRASR